MSGSGSGHGEGLTIPDAPLGGTRDARSRRPGFAIAGTFCLALIVAGSWFAVVFAMGLTREIGIDASLIGLDDLVVALILSLPGFGLAFLGVWFLRKARMDRFTGWVCLTCAGAILVMGVAGVVMAVAEFADTEGTGAVLASRSGGVWGLAIALYLVWAGLRSLDTATHR